MAWFMTESVEEYLAAAGDFLMSRLVENTVLLTVAETLRVRGMSAFGEAAPLFGWWRSPGGAVESAFLHTPPSPVLLTKAPSEAMEPLVECWPDGRPMSGVDAGEEVASAFASAWQERTAAMLYLHRRERLYRLGSLVLPRSGPPGRSRVASATDRDLLVDWVTAFQKETSGVVGNAAERVDDRLSYGGFTLWEVDGAPVSAAGITRPMGGMVRIAPVYTPSGLRRVGYAGGATAAVSQAALDAGAQEVLLFADLANPTSNGLYQRLGFEPVGNRVTLLLAPPPPPGNDRNA
ncbi:GNAT family N-acetyltransferase [Frankia sp. AgB1.9]|uniref:GNAT family N-acetyltransferase n=1 Tax=unclassified Frankia TaxID=2632575 RepID=UPI001933A4B7|nr:MULTISPECIES: GNAT family N-acetyltransferase [unclassified Frankia]MBL7487727.1 GNAT family N-acetyltransferase [Frankia sp. AgW1.1]MBL7548030.1 GNAT family N-acetyltransferase [Frankia sp. AgB1.9]MBL7624106.1 GNAT family N-acetyltransferase [Frankia sp. AgB1.8]